MATAIRFGTTISNLASTRPDVVGHGAVFATKSGANHASLGTALAVLPRRAIVRADIGNRRKTVFDGDATANNGRMSKIDNSKRVCCDVHMICIRVMRVRIAPAPAEASGFSPHTTHTRKSSPHPFPEISDFIPCRDQPHHLSRNRRLLLPHVAHGLKYPGSRRKT